MRVAAVAAAARRAGRRTTGRLRREIEADHAARRATPRAAAATTAAKPCSTTSTFTAASRQDEHLLGHREAPVQRHQHRAEPRAGIEQHQIVGMVGREDRDAVAAPDAEPRFQRARGLRDALGKRRIGQRRGRRNRSAGLSGVNAALRSMRSERSMRCYGVTWQATAAASLIRLARLVQRLAAEPVQADFGGPGQHQRAAAAVAIDAFERAGS